MKFCKNKRILRPKRMLAAALLCLLASTGLWTLPALGGAGQAGWLTPQMKLRGGMLGQSGISLDLNGDGLEDLVVGAPYAQYQGAIGALFIYAGTPKGLASRPAVFWGGDGNLGWSLAALGNLYGKGRAAFAASAFSGSSGSGSRTGTVTIYQIMGNKLQKLTVLSGENAMDKFGYSLAVGDLNGDGSPDLIVGAPFHSPSTAYYQQGAVYIFFGPAYNPARAIKIPASSYHGGIGFSLAAGDINGDGIDDLLIGASGRVCVYYGAQGGYFTPNLTGPAAVFRSADSGFGRAIAVLGDLNGDGLKEVAVGANQATVNNVIDSGRLFIFKGGAGKRTVNGDSPSVDLLAKIDGEPNCGRFASAILPVGDLDGDGIPELAVSAIHADGNPWPVTGKIFLFSGGTLTSTASVATAQAFSGDAGNMHLGSFLALVNKGTGLAAGAPMENANTGKIRFYPLPMNGQ